MGMGSPLNSPQWCVTYLRTLCLSIGPRWERRIRTFIVLIQSQVSCQLLYLPMEPKPPNL